MHVSPATVIATLALVFAITGGAYAAGKYVITSPKQIKPSVLKSLQGRAGANGAPGAAGAAGPQGSAGPAGSAGPKGETGAPGAPGTKGQNGATGPQGAPGLSGWAEKLPPGKTLTGMYAASTYAPGAFEGKARTSVNFPFRVENGAGEGPKVHYIKAPTKEEIHKGEFPTPPAGCTGTYLKPGALEGNLCIFSYQEANITTLVNGGIPYICDFTREEGCPSAPYTNASPIGFSLAALAGATGEVEIQGTWTVTAEE